MAAFGSGEDGQGEVPVTPKGGGMLMETPEILPS